MEVKKIKAQKGKDREEENIYEGQDGAFKEGVNETKGKNLEMT
jgi:hypothetical protein